MSGYVSPFGNASQNFLYNPLLAQTQTSNENALLIQQQDISGHEIEMGARLAGTLLSAYDTPEARAAAYPSLLAQARSVAPGYFKNAPAVYPGDEPTRALARMGTPSKDLYAQGVDRTAKGAIAPGDGGTTATGGTGTVGGADTAPINAAGDSRTRKAAEGGPPAAGSPGAAVAKQVHDFWISKGFSEEQTAGIMAGGPGSESDFTPTVFGDKGTSYGLYQHHGPRLDAMRQFFGLSSSQNPTADQQNQYAHWEITQGPLKNVGEMLKTAKTPAEAAAIWTQYFGVPADKSEIGRRAAGAQRFVGLYGGQPGAPGAPAAPGVVMGQVGRPGDVPPPPWGAPGGYQATGGGMGAVIGRPAPVVGTSPIPAGRPTGPPVITDQPAGSNVVAGPPGVATVGAPQPPSPEVPGNVAAINAGIVARGGQPVTDPNLTPTPARYAGTAPAPSVEALPETGWGSQVGSGYGPQNTLAPAPVPPAPARPAAQPATAQPTAAQPPAADTLPPLPAPTPPAPTNRNGLTPAQQQDINTRRNLPNVSADELQKRVDSYVGANAAAAEKYQQDQIAYVREARERQSSAQAQQDRAQAQQLAREAAQRDAERLKLSQQADQRAADKAKQEADAAGRPLQGNDVDIQHERILNDLADKIRDGTATEAEKRLYSGSYYALQQKGGQAVQITDPNNPGGTIAATITRRLPPSLPEPPGGALPQVFTTPGAAKAPEMTAPQSQAAGFADRMRNALPVISDTSPAAMSRWQQVLGEIPLVGNAYVSADFQRHLQSERDFINAVLRRESGAAISESEFVNARKQYIPQPGDKPPVLADKARNRETVLANLIRDAGPAYRPPTGSTTQSSTTSPPSRVIRYDHTGKRIDE